MEARDPHTKSNVDKPRQPVRNIWRHMTYEKQTKETKAFVSFERIHPAGKVTRVSRTTREGKW